MAVAGEVVPLLLTPSLQFHDLTLDDLTRPDTVFQIGVPPSRVAILTGISGVQFEEAWPNRVLVNVEGGEVPVISRENLIRNKRATWRPKDIPDIAALEL